MITKMKTPKFYIPKDEVTPEICSLIETTERKINVNSFPKVSAKSTTPTFLRIYDDGSADYVNDIIGLHPFEKHKILDISKNGISALEDFYNSLS